MMKNLVSQLHRYGGDSGGPCLMEAVSVYADEPLTAWPDCADPDLTHLGQAINDAIEDDDERDALRRYIPLMVGTANDGHERERAAKMVAWADEQFDRVSTRLRNRHPVEWAAVSDAIHMAELRATGKPLPDGEVGVRVGAALGAMTSQLGQIIPTDAMTGLLDELLVATVPQAWGEAGVEPIRSSSRVHHSSLIPDRLTSPL